MIHSTIGGNYSILKRLGTGGFGSVYLAHDRNLDRPCAVKAVFGNNLREARLLSKLDHPNLPFVYDCFQHEHKTVIIMEYVKGNTYDRLNVAEASKYIMQIGKALIYLHDNNLVHGDVKPNNILINKDKAVLVDFGLTTPVGKVVSGYTEGFAAPEQCLSKPVNGYADLYSLGATFYTWITGQIPQPSTYRLIEDKLERPSLYVNISEELEEAIMKAMSLDINERMW